MATNEEIMDMLKLILGKVERLESINTENVTISSGTITIHAEDGAIDIQEAEDILIQTGGNNPVSIEQAEEIKVDDPVAGSVTIGCNGSIEGDVTVNASNGAKPTVSVDCKGDIHSDVQGNPQMIKMSSLSLK